MADKVRSLAGARSLLPGEGQGSATSSHRGLAASQSLGHIGLENQPREQEGCFGMELFQLIFSPWTYLSILREDGE